MKGETRFHVLRAPGGGPVQGGAREREIERKRNRETGRQKKTSKRESSETN